MIIDRASLRKFQLSPEAEILKRKKDWRTKALGAEIKCGTHFFRNPFASHSIFVRASKNRDESENNVT